MTQNQVFPNVNTKDFDEMDKICHSLIEASYIKNFSTDFLNSMMNYLAVYQQRNKNFIIDALFMKYLKQFKKDVNQHEISVLADTMSNNQQINSQYHIAFICFCDDSDQLKLHEQLLSQSWKIRNEDEISINEIDISNTISLYLLKEEEVYLDNDISNQIYDQIYFSNKGPDQTLNLMQTPEDISKVNKYYPLSLWESLTIKDNLTEINVADNPFLFHAAACLNYTNSSIKVQYDTKNFQYPENVSYDLIKFTIKKVPITDFLNIKTLSTKVKNLCTLTYFLISNKVSPRDLRYYQGIMKPRSFLILSMIYYNYINKDISNLLLNLINDQIDIYNSSDITLAHFFFTILEPSFYDYLNEKTKDILYIAPQRIFNTKMNKSFPSSKEYYGYLKKRFMKGDIRKEGKEKVFNNNKKDLSRFVQLAFLLFPLRIQKQIICTYDVDVSNPCFAIHLLLIDIEVGDYIEAVKKIKCINQTEELENLFKKETNIPNIKNFLTHAAPDDSLDIIFKFDLISLFSADELIMIYFNLIFPGIEIEVDRNNILSSSMNEFKIKNIKERRIRIKYKSEKGIDHGGLSKDWFINVSNAILETGVFKPVPNGSSLTINEDNINKKVCYFTGQLIASAFNNQRNINIKLTSFIWKILLNEQINLEDMKNYDNEMYQSLFWISENDPKQAMMTFVDSNDEDLCPNGKNIEVTEENKKEYIKLIMKKKFIDKKVEAFGFLLKGFKNSLNYDYVKFFNSETVKDLVVGSETIDCNDWKKNTEYDRLYSSKFNQFFEVISNWPQPKLKKLLKFITGSSVVPIGGFSNFYSIGGNLRIEFISGDSDSLPTSHTCSNSLTLHCYSSKEKLDEKLSLAIECDDFALT